MKRITIDLPDNTDIISLTAMQTEQKEMHLSVYAASRCIDVTRHKHISYDGKEWSEDEANV